MAIGRKATDRIRDRYTAIKNAYHSVPWAALGLSDHCLVHLIPTFKSNQIKSLLLSHHHSTSALGSEILTSVLQTVQKKQTKKTIYIWTVHIYRLTDNVQNTHTYTQYTQCTIKTYLVIDTHYT